VVFNRKGPDDDQVRSDQQSALVERLLEADELERRQLLLIALQTGELKKSEAGELLRLVERLESVARKE
jgi:myo-inositol catabolism protein IolC